MEQLLSSADFTLDAFLVAAFVGVVLALLALLWNKSVCGKFVRFLVKNHVESPDSAVTLEKAGCGRNLLLRFSLRNGSMMRKLVLKTDADSPAYYLPAENAERASLVYNNKGTNPISVFISVLLVVGIAFLVRFLVPNLTQMFRNFLDILKNPNG